MEVDDNFSGDNDGVLITVDGAVKRVSRRKVRRANQPLRRVMLDPQKTLEREALLKRHRELEAGICTA